MAYEDDDQLDGFVPWEPPQEERVQASAAADDPENAPPYQVAGGWQPPPTRGRESLEGFVPWEPPQQQQQQVQPQASGGLNGFVPWEPPQERPEAEGVIGTAAREAAGATPATLGGLAAGAGAAGVGRVAGAALGRAIGGLGGTLGGPAGTVAGWIGGGLVGGYIGEELAKGIKSFLGFDDTAQRQANVEANPIAAAAGQVAPLALGLSPGSGAQTVNRLLSGGIGGAIEGATQIAEGEFSPARLGANVIAGAALPGNRAWLSRLEASGVKAAGGRLGEAQRAQAAAEPQQPPWPEKTWPEGAPGPTPDWPGGMWPEGEPIPARPERPTPPPGEAPVWPDSTWPNEEPQPSGRTDRQGFTPGGRYEEPRPGTGYEEPARPSLPPADTPVAPHGTPGSEGPAGTAQAQPPPVEGVAGPEMTRAGGPEDWSKKTTPAEGGNGINVGDIDPTLAHTLKAETPAATQPAQQAGPMADLDARLNFALHGEPGGPKRPAAEVPGELRKIAADYEKMGQPGQVQKIEQVARAIEANLPPEPARTAALEQPQDVLKGPAPAVEPATRTGGEQRTPVATSGEATGVLPEKQPFYEAAKAEAPNLPEAQLTHIANLAGGPKGAALMARNAARRMAEDIGAPAARVAEAERAPSDRGQQFAQQEQQQFANQPPKPTGLSFGEEAFGSPPGKPPPGGQPPRPPPPPPPSTPGPPPAAGSIEAANAAISKRIAPPSPSLLERIPRDWEGVKQTAHDFYTKAKDALHPLKQLAGEGLSPEEDFYKLSRLIRGLPGRVLQQLEYGTYDIETRKVNGDPLVKVLKSVEKDEGFVNYAIAKHAQELEARGVKTGMPMPEVNQVVAVGAAKYEPVMRELVDYQGRVLTNLRKSGMISAVAEAKMRDMNKSYIPYYRMLDPNSELGQQLGVKPGVQATDPMHRIKGSERQIIDPIDSIVKNTYLFTDAAHKNLAMQALEDWVLKNPQGNKIMQLRADQPKAVRAEVLQFMKDNGISGEMRDALENFQWTAATKGDNTVKVFRDGKARTYEVFDPAVATAVKSMDREAFDLLTTILKGPASLMRAGATLSPEFIARNPIRDQFTAWIQSKHGYIPVYDMVRGMGHLWKKSEQFQSWLTEGGANATLVGIDRKLVGTNPKDLIGRVPNVITSPIRALRVASEFMENATRMGEFLRATGKGVSPTEAAFASREVALDFARVGSKARALNAIIPFFNAQLEGVDRAARAFRDNPTGTLVKVGAGVTAPSVALWFANKDDARYKELPQWQKDLFWIIPTDNWKDISAADASKIGAAHKRRVDGQWQRNYGTIYRIPKPFEIGILFGSIPERALDAYYNQNPNAFKNLGKTVFEGLTPGFIPQAAVPVLEQFANRSTFLDRTLVPKNLEGLPPRLQFTPYTSETAKVLGNIVSTFAPKSSFSSPIILDNYIRQYTGGLGGHVVDLMDKSLEATGAVEGKNRPTSTAADMPLFKAFVSRFPSAGSQSVQDFYDTYGERKTALAEAKFHQKRGEPINVALQNPGEAMHQQIGNLHKKIREAYENPKMPAEQKRDFIDSTYLQIIETARRGNEMYERTKRRSP